METFKDDLIPDDYNIGDRVFFLETNASRPKILEGVIVEVKVVNEEERVTFAYACEDYRFVYRTVTFGKDFLFNSLEDLANFYYNPLPNLIMEYAEKIIKKTSEN